MIYKYIILYTIWIYYCNYHISYIKGIRTINKKSIKNYIIIIKYNKIFNKIKNSLNINIKYRNFKVIKNYKVIKYTIR